MIATVIATMIPTNGKTGLEFCYILVRINQLITVRVSKGFRCQRIGSKMPIGCPFKVGAWSKHRFCPFWKSENQNTEQMPLPHTFIYIKLLWSIYVLLFCCSIQQKIISINMNSHLLQYLFTFTNI